MNFFAPDMGSDSIVRVDFWFTGYNADILVETKYPDAGVKNLAQILHYMWLRQSMKDYVLKHRTLDKKGRSLVKKHRIVGILMAPHITNELLNTVEFLDDLYAIQTRHWRWN
jgi:hypothetical protein